MSKLGERLVSIAKKNQKDPDIVREAIEAAFYEWWAENGNAFLLGRKIDVCDLMVRLAAAGGVAAGIIDDELV